MEKDKQEELGVLWRKSSKKGNEYYSGKINIGGKITEIVIFHIISKNPLGPNLRIIHSRFNMEKEYANESNRE